MGIFDGYLLVSDMDGTLLNSKGKLSEENKKQFYIPKGFAHGFLVLSDEAEFAYKCDDIYNHEAEGGLKFDDPDIGIEWPMGDLKPEDLIRLTNGQCADIIKD